MRNDAENIKLLEQAKPQFEKLKNTQMRLSIEAQHIEAEIAAEEARAVELLGTHDAAEMDKIISEAWADNTSVVDEFVSVIDGINREFARIAGTSEPVASTAPRLQTPPRPMPPR